MTVEKQGDRRLVKSEITSDLRGKNVLLVEDVLESGTSLIAARDYLEAVGAHVSTASLYIQPQAKVIPDYYIAERQAVPVFPWD